MRLTALAESVVLTQSSISRLIDRLEQAELVRREPFAGDGRGADAVLTEEGLARVHAAKVTQLAAIRAHFLDHLTEAQRTTLARVWERRLLPTPPAPARRPAPFRRSRADVLYVVPARFRARAGPHVAVLQLIADRHGTVLHADLPRAARRTHDSPRLGGPRGGACGRGGLPGG